MARILSVVVEVIPFTDSVVVVVSCIMIGDSSMTGDSTMISDSTITAEDEFDVEFMTALVSKKVSSPSSSIPRGYGNGF